VLFFCTPEPFSIPSSFFINSETGGENTYTIGDFTYSGDKLLDYLYNDISQKIINMRRDYDEPYNVITIKIGNVADIPFDTDNNISRKEITIEAEYKKAYT